MGGDPREVGVTNLGPVPEGMTFLEAVEAAKVLRKYTIDPERIGHRLTVCEMQREIWRIAGNLPEPERSNLRMLAGAAFDAGKRMDARMKQLKAALTKAGVAIP